MQNVYKKSCKTLNLCVLCIQMLYKRKFRMIMNVQEMCIKSLYLYKKCTNCMKLVHANWESKRIFKLTMYVCLLANNVQTIQSLHK